MKTIPLSSPQVLNPLFGTQPAELVSQPLIEQVPRQVTLSRAKRRIASGFYDRDDVLEHTIENILARLEPSPPLMALVTKRDTRDKSVTPSDDERLR